VAGVLDVSSERTSARLQAVGAQQRKRRINSLTAHSPHFYTRALQCDPVEHFYTRPYSVTRKNNKILIFVQSDRQTSVIVW